MRQSDARTPGRRPGPPASFGRGEDEGKPQPEDFTIRGGEAFHLVLHVEVQPDAESLEALRAAIRETTRAAVLEGYAEAFAEMDAAGRPPEEQPAEQERPGGGHGGAPPG